MPKSPPGAVRRFEEYVLPDDSCRRCGTTKGPLSPGQPEPLGDDVVRETAICTRCLTSGGIAQ